MAKVYKLSIPEFFEHGFPRPPTMQDRVVIHIKRHRMFYIQMVVITIPLAIMGAADPSMATGTTAIDLKAHKIYSRLCTIGKWIIVVRGGVDIISSMTQGELDTMKKRVMGYVVGYVALLGLPWLLDQASLLFDGTDTI